MTRRWRRGEPRLIQEILSMSQMTMPVQTVCRSCNRPIFWASCTSTGNPMPVDVEPVPGGNVLLYRRSNGLLRAEVLGKDVPRSPERKYRINHFATCKNADQHRKGT